MLNRLSCRLDAAGITPMRSVAHTKPVVRTSANTAVLVLEMDKVLSEGLIEAIFTSDSLSISLKAAIHKELGLGLSSKTKLVSLWSEDDEGKAYYLVRDLMTGHDGVWISEQTHVALVKAANTNKLSYRQALTSKL